MFSSLSSLNGDDVDGALEVASSAIVDCIYSTNTKVGETQPLMLLCKAICSNLPTVEPRIRCYLDYKLFGQPPLHTFPIWSDQSMILDTEVKSILKLMISPKGSDNACYKVYATDTNDFDFDKFSRLTLTVRQQT